MGIQAEDTLYPTLTLLIDHRLTVQEWLFQAQFFWVPESFKYNWVIILFLIQKSV